MQASLLSARLVYGLLLALFSVAGQSAEDTSVLVDQFRSTDLVATYLVTEEAGAVAVARLAERGAPENVALLDRVPGASHLYTELENERVYSLATFFAEEYRLQRESQLVLELPAYPEAMIRLAQAGGAEDESPGEETAEETSGEDEPEVREEGVSPRRLSIAAGVLPREAWHFRRSGRLSYVRSAGADWLLIARETP